jgi:RNA polymerase sigma factor (sigma-70 family)
MTDAEIIARVRQGDREAYSLLVDRYRSVIYALACHHLRNAEDARDVAQEAFVQGFLRLGQLRDPDRFVAWLRQITLNECRRWHRCRRPTALSEPAPASSLDVEGVVGRLAVEQALECLSEATRLTLRLYYMRRYSLREIADFLDVPVSTVKSRLRDARARLRRELMEEAEKQLQEEPLPESFTQEVLKLTSRVMKPIDREALARFLSQDRPAHLCLLAELEREGSLAETPEGCLTYWGVEAGGELVGAIMRIGFNWVPARSHPGSAELLARHLDEYDGRQLIYGPAETVAAIVARLTRHRAVERSEQSFERVEQLAVDPAALPPARRASLANAGRVIELYDNPEVPRHASSVRAHIDSEHSGLRLWFCEDETGRAVSACFTRYEASDLAYVDFVYTRPEARGQGWATACVAGICAELLSEGKRPCFCYDTTKRGDLYRKVGARPYATWRYVETTPVE